MPKQKSRKKAVSSARSKSVRHRSAKSKRKSQASLHKRFLLHPIFVLIFLCAGILIIGYTYHVVADSYTVTASVAAPILGEGATILNPLDGDSITDAPIIVSGSCPYESYIKLYDNSLFSGTAWCSSGNTFQITTDLYTGSNSLLAQDYNVTDQPGPATSAVLVTYTPPVTPPATGGGSSTSSGSTTSTNTNSSTSTGTGTSTTPAETIPETVVEPSSGTTPLVLTSDFHFQTFVSKDVFTWTLDVEGGIPPYVVTVNWGDGTSTTYNFKTDPQFQITHTYASTGYYPVIVTSKDKVGNTRLLQLAALIRLPGNSNLYNPVAGATTCNSTGVNASSSASCKTPTSTGSTKSTNTFNVGDAIHSVKSWLWIAWSSYLIIFLMILSFWLGEREEYYHLFRRKQLSYVRAARGHKRR